MIKLCVRSLFFIVAIFPFARTLAQSSPAEVSGQMRMRAESKSINEYTNFVGTRVRVDVKFKPNDQVHIFLQPQFAKVWGEPEAVPSTATANSITASSGSLNDTGLDVHQGYLQYFFNESLIVTLGRKELNYGDQLLVGGVGWSHVGRSFDLLLGTYKYTFGAADVFSAKIKDSNTSGGGVGDKDFSGIYLNNTFSDWLQNGDVYAFLSEDHTTTIHSATAAYGFRIKSPISSFDYRVEATVEDLKGAQGQASASQWDVELGYELAANKKLRLSGEYFSSSENFDQLYPTGHKWLGYADLFSRRNIKGYRLGVFSQMSDVFNISVDYHEFQRSEASAPAYKFSGASYGANGRDSEVANEIDVVLSYKLSGGLIAEFGASRGEPKQYLKSNGYSDIMSFYYLQLSAVF